MEERSIQLLADGVNVGEGCRMHLKGRATMTCFPDAFQVDVYNLDGEGRARLERAQTVAVLGAYQSVLCQGELQDMVTAQADGNEVTTLFFTDGEGFFRSATSLSLRKGATLQESLSAVVAHASCPLPLVYLPQEGATLPRGQVFHGRSVEAVNALSSAFSARAYVHRGGLYVQRLEEAPPQMTLTDDDLLDAPILFEGGAVVRLEMIGVVMGQRIQLKTAEMDCTLRAVVQSFDADSLKGAWRTEITLLNESALKADHGSWEGG